MTQRATVLIVGGGIAALETALGLYESPNFSADVALVAPNEKFYYRPFAVLEPFGFHQNAELALGELLKDSRTTLIHDSVARVDLDLKVATLGGGEAIEFDALVIATGAAQSEGIKGATTVGGPDGTAGVARLLTEIDSGTLRRIAFVAARGASWTLPIYELALLTAARAAHRRGSGIRIAVITPERQPLGIFGPEASDRVTALLRDAEIELHTAESALSFADGVITTLARTEIKADRTVALPILTGHRIDGLPQNEAGFLAVDEHGLVSGQRDLYAAGDTTDFPVKQGTIASQQAEAVVESLACRCGSQEQARAFVPQLHGVLFSTHGKTVMDALRGPGGQTSDAIPEQLLEDDAEKFYSRYLGRRMQQLRARSMRS
ncbi:MAG: NAD(P)/FAD-dependent oxidoreductase [Solirubrobacterales bacterium]